MKIVKGLTIFSKLHRRSFSGFQIIRFLFTQKILILSQDKGAVKKENEDLNNQLQKLSFDYQTRLKQYISDIKVSGLEFYVTM